MTAINRPVALVFAILLMTTTPIIAFDNSHDAIIGDSSDMDAIDSLIMPAQNFFVENVGQLSNEAVRFYLQLNRGAIGFGDSSIFMRLDEALGQVDELPREDSRNEIETSTRTSPMHSTLIRISFEASRTVVPIARQELPHRNAFFLGDDHSRWRSNVRAFSEIVYPDLYENIDLVYHSTSQGLKYDFVVHPGGNPNDIVVRYEGVENLDISPSRVSIATAVGDIRDDSIVGLQGGHTIPCTFVPIDEISHGFSCEGWDSGQDLTIDPLLYSTYIGGKTGFGGGRDTPFSIAVDSNGDIYAVGETESTDFPTTPGTFDSTLNGTSDAYLVKIRPGGNGPADLLYSAYIGGDNYDQGRSVWVNASGYVYISGRTWSTNFPTTPGAFDEDANPPVTDGFFLILQTEGNDLKDLVYSTYLGGTGNDEVKGLAVDGIGRVNLCGLTNSSDFPVTAGAYNTTLNGSYDAFLTIIEPLGTGPNDLLYSTYYGGVNGDYCYGLALDGGRAYLTGHTYGDIPTTVGAFNRTFNGAWDGLFAVINPLGTGSADLEYATLFGGTNSDTPYAIATYAGNALITGYTHSPNFPTTPGAFDRLYNVSSDGFFVKFNPAGGGASDLLYGTFFGGTKIENPAAIAVDASGNAIITGQTGSPEFNTTVGAFDEVKNGGEDAFLMKIVPAGGGESDLAYSTFFGGGSEDEGWGVTVDSTGIVYMAVRTFISPVPTTAGAYSESIIGSVDTVIVKLDLGPNTPPIANAGIDQSSPRNATVFLNGSGSQDPDGVPLRYRWTNESGPGLGPVTIVNSTSMLASFIPDRLGTYTFNLTITDGDGATDYDLMNVYVSNVLPTAQLSVTPLSLRTGETATLNATASYDPDGAIMLYNFTFGDGNWTENTVGVVTYSWTSSGNYQVNVTVTDGDGASDTARTTVFIMSNMPPVANAGPDAMYPKNQTIMLNATSSYDPEGDPLFFAWVQIGGPPATITNGTTATPSVFIQLSGVYNFQVWVNDSLGGSDSDTVQITAINTAPLANAGMDQTVPRNSVVTLDGSASADLENDTLTFAWVQTAGPSVTLSNANTPVATFTATILGTYTFNLTVDDGDGGTDTDTVSITVFNRPPAITSTTPMSSAVTVLENKGSLFFVIAMDPDSDLITYSWTVNSVPQSNTTSSFYFIRSQAGTYYVNITVSDGDLTDSNSWIVAVSEPPPDVPPVSDVPFLLIGIILAAIVIIVIALLLWWRRRTSARTEEPAPIVETGDQKPPMP